MSSMDLKIMNQGTEPNTVLYLPYGVSTIEMRVLGNTAGVDGYLYPENRSNGYNKFYVGYVDDKNCDDFLVIWGGGKRNGLPLNENNINGRHFINVLHQGKTITRKSLSLWYEDSQSPLSRIELVPANDDKDLVRTSRYNNGNAETLHFEGSKMPVYYSRWFPQPRPVELTKKIEYCDVFTPQIDIKFKSKHDPTSTSIDSDVDIYLNSKKIAVISEDWLYSWLHADLFTVFGDEKYLVLRVWFYWIHENFSKSLLRGEKLSLDNIERPRDEETKRGLWELFDIESPDIERFDFLIDMNSERIIWMGTDFHYQEAWYKFPGQPAIVNARIANDFSTIKEVFLQVSNRLGYQPPKNFDPITRLKEIIKSNRDLAGIEMPHLEKSVVSNQDKEGKVMYRGEGLTRKHIPYAENAEVVDELISSVVTS